MINIRCVFLFSIWWYGAWKYPRIVNSLQEMRNSSESGRHVCDWSKHFSHRRTHAESFVLVSAMQENWSAPHVLLQSAGSMLHTKWRQNLNAPLENISLANSFSLRTQNNPMQLWKRLCISIQCYYWPVASCLSDYAYHHELYELALLLCFYCLSV